MKDDGREPVDDIDRLFVGLATIDTPRDFLSRIAAQTFLRDAPLSLYLPHRWFIWLSMDIFALAIFAFLSVGLGIEMSEAGTFDLLVLAFDTASIGGQFSLFGEAVLQSLPWIQIFLMALNLAAIVYLSRRTLPILPSGTGQVAVVQ